MKNDVLQKVKVQGVYSIKTPQGASSMVLLENEEQQILPIYVGTTEAISIQTVLENRPTPRPLTPDLLINILEGLNSRVDKVIIDDIKEGVYYAKVVVKWKEGISEFDARPSDGVALAVRSEAPVYVTDDVIKAAAVERKSIEIW